MEHLLIAGLSGHERLGDVLRQGQYYKVDLPGDMRNLRSLDLSCHAQGARRVTIQIFVSK